MTMDKESQEPLQDEVLALRRRVAELEQELASSRKATTDDRKYSQELLQMVMDHIPQTIFWKDRSSVFLGCNRRFAELNGVASPSEIIGKTDLEMPWRELAELYRADDKRVMESDTPKLNFEESLQRADGMGWARTSKIPLHDATGAVVAILGMYEDITESKRVEVERLRLQEEIIRAQADALAELSTPLIPITDTVMVMPLSLTRLARSIERREPGRSSLQIEHHHVRRRIGPDRELGGADTARDEHRGPFGLVETIGPAARIISSGEDHRAVSRKRDLTAVSMAAEKEGDVAAPDMGEPAGGVADGDLQQSRSIGARGLRRGLTDTGKSAVAVRLSGPRVIDPDDRHVVVWRIEPQRGIDEHGRPCARQRLLEQRMVRPQIVVSEHRHLHFGRNAPDLRLQRAGYRGRRVEEHVITTEDQHVRIRRREQPECLLDRALGRRRPEMQIGGERDTERRGEASRRREHDRVPDELHGRRSGHPLPEPGRPGRGINDPQRRFDHPATE